MSKFLSDDFGVGGGGLADVHEPFVESEFSYGRQIPAPTEEELQKASPLFATERVISFARYQLSYQERESIEDVLRRAEVPTYLIRNVIQSEQHDFTDAQIGAIIEGYPEFRDEMLSLRKFNDDELKDKFLGWHSHLNVLEARSLCDFYGENLVREAAIAISKTKTIPGDSFKRSRDSLRDLTGESFINQLSQVIGSDGFGYCHIETIRSRGPFLEVGFGGGAGWHAGRGHALTCLRGIGKVILCRDTWVS